MVEHSHKVLELLMAARPAVSAIVCSFDEDRWDDLNAAVESLLRQTESPHEIIVVIDHNPALYRRARTELEGVTVIENPEVRGSSGARNAGVAVTRGDVIAFMDDDAVAEPDWLERLTGRLDDDRIMGVAGRIDPLWSSIRPRWLPEEFFWVIGCTYRGAATASGPIRNVWGCMVIRRDVFDAVEGFRTGIDRTGSRPVGAEETELSIRASHLWPDRVWQYDATARMLHRVHPERATWRYFCSRCYTQGMTKALMARQVGAADGLASERTHALRTLPRGVARGVRDAFQGDMAGIARAGAIIGGLALAAIGYAVTRARMSLSGMQVR